MKLQQKKFISKAVVIFIALSIPSAIIAQSTSAQSTSTTGVIDYCLQYDTTPTAKDDYNSQEIACRDGWKGADCSDYLITHDQAHVDICQKSAKTKADFDKNSGNNNNNNGGTNNGSNNGSSNNSNSGSNTGNTNTSNSGSSDTLQQIIDQLKELQGESNDKDPDKIADNNYGQYVNGRGDLQPIRVSKAEGGNNPAIIFFNGGGWHADDRAGDKIAPKAVERGYTTFVATYRLGSSGIYYMYEDVMRAIRHVRNNASMYGIDPNRIALWGDSAGGHLALRAATSGKSGAAAMVGWSTPSNAYTGIFRSVRSFAIAMDHSTCVPTDINGVSSIVDQLNGGDGKVDNDGGLGNNGTAGTDTALGTVTQVLELAQTAQQTGKNIESISKQLNNSSSSGTSDSSNSSNSSSSSSSGSSSSSSSSSSNLSQNVRRLAAKKFIECIDNFNVASPALFASPLSPPGFFAGYEHDPLVGPDQIYQMRDKLRSLGVQSSALVLPGLANSDVVEGENHLDYHEQFVKPSLDWLDNILHPPNAPEQ